jgi:hypothetical protein
LTVKQPHAESYHCLSMPQQFLPGKAADVVKKVISDIRSLSPVTAQTVVDFLADVRPKACFSALVQQMLFFLLSCNLWANCWCVIACGLLLLQEVKKMKAVMSKATGIIAYIKKASTNISIALCLDESAFKLARKIMYC